LRSVNSSSNVVYLKSLGENITPDQVANFLGNQKAAMANGPTNGVMSTALRLYFQGVISLIILKDYFPPLSSVVKANFLNYEGPGVN
jgi:hypothetical protein